MKNAIACLVLINLAFSAVSENIFYVRTDGAGTKCERKDPCGTIQRAVDLAKGGDKIDIGVGDFVENVLVPTGKNGLRLIGKSSKRTSVIATGGDDETNTVVSIMSNQVFLTRLSIIHPARVAEKREVGVYIGGERVRVHNSNIMHEKGGSSEFSSVGIDISGENARITKNTITGPYNVLVSVSASRCEVRDNAIDGAASVGVAISDARAERNFVIGNNIENNGVFGVEIAGVKNTVRANVIHNNGDYGVHLCGGTSSDCLVEGATSSSNTIISNKFSQNGQGDWEDGGEGNKFRDN